MIALAPIEHAETRRCVDAERAFLAELGGDCNLPAGAYARPAPDGDGLLLLGRAAPRSTGTASCATAPSVATRSALGTSTARHLRTIRGQPYPSDRVASGLSSLPKGQVEFAGRTTGVEAHGGRLEEGLDGTG